MPRRPASRVGAGNRRPQGGEAVMLKNICGAISRRVAMVGAVAWPLAAAAAKNSGVAGDSSQSASARAVAGLVTRTEQAAVALIRGDLHAYLELIRHADDYVLMQP